MASPMELILKMNKLELSSNGTTTKPKMIGDKTYTYSLENLGEVIRVKRKIGSTVDAEFKIPVKLTELYNHVMAPRVIIHETANEETVYQKIPSSDPFMLLFLAAPRDVVSIIRLVAYRNAGTQKTQTIYSVV